MVAAPPFNPESYDLPLKDADKAKALSWMHSLIGLKFGVHSGPLVLNINGTYTLEASGTISASLYNTIAAENSRDLFYTYYSVWTNFHGGPLDKNPDDQPGHISALDPITNPINNVIDFLANLWDTLTSAEFWIRAAEFLLGVALVGIAVAHLTGNQNAVSKVAGAGLEGAKSAGSSAGSAAASGARKSYAGAARAGKYFRYFGE